MALPYMKTVNIQENRVKIDNLNINYKIIGDGNIAIILLHGWGVSSDKYSVLAEYLSEVKSEKLKVKSYRIYLLDLPGFGKSDNPPKSWGVDEYAEFVKDFTDVRLGGLASKSDLEARPPSKWQENKRVILIGHSFGGQIAIKFAAKYPEQLKALILTGAAGIKHSPTLKLKIFYILAKTGKIIFSLPLINKLEKPAQKLLYKTAREKDYYHAQGIMKEVFKKVVGEDLSGYLDKIKTPTLLIWGKNDKSTPLADGEIMKLKIENCDLKILDDANHQAPYQYPEKFAKIAAEFIKKGRAII
ncbi:alpha/beta hydrolase [Patescibacteria group bacterium]|nr:alpha/beta hydrolase [Patescibacteria group bacterium]